MKSSISSLYSHGHCRRLSECDAVSSLCNNNFMDYGSKHLLWYLLDPGPLQQTYIGPVEFVLVAPKLPVVLLVSLGVAELGSRLN